MFDWGEVLEIFRTLLASTMEPREAVARTVASRAYYFAFHRCRRAVERNADMPLAAEASVHAIVIRRLGEQQETRSISLDLDRLRGNRAHADYNADRPFLESKAEVAIELASEISQAIERELGD